MRKPATLLTISAAIGLSACTADFYREAGASIDEGGFGNPTMNNQLVHTESGIKSSTCRGNSRRRCRPP